MANPWDADEIVAPAPRATRTQPRATNPWDNDEVVAPADPGFRRTPEGLEIDIVGGANDVPAKLGDVAPQRSTLEELGHQFSYQGREFLGGLGDLAGLFVDPVAAGMEKLGLPHGYRGRELATMAADALGLDQAETAREETLGSVQRALGGTVAGIGGGRLLSQAANPIAAGVGKFLATQPGVQTVSSVGGGAAGGLARENGATEGEQLAATLAGGLAPVASLPALKGATRVALRGGEAGRQRVQDAIEDFAALGSTPSVSQATGRRFNQATETVLSGGPISGGVMTRAAERQAEEIGQGLRARADALAPGATAERAGRAIERGADLAAKNIGAMRKALYWQADRQIPQSTVLPLARTRQALDSMTTPTPGAENTTRLLINPKLSSAPSHHSAGGIREALEADIAAAQQQGMAGIPYSAARDLRSRIGRELEDFTLSADKPTAEYRRLYAALSADLEDAAKRAGPDAERAMKRATRYYRASADRLETLERVIDRNGGPEKVYGAVLSGTRDGATVLRSVTRSLPDDAHRMLTAAVIKRMGMARPNAQDVAGETFSAQSFLTNWNSISREAKSALFSRLGPTFVNDMNKVARVAETIRNGAKVFANPSGTADRVQLGVHAAALAGAGWIQSPSATAAVVGWAGLGAPAIAKIMTSPRVVRALAEKTEVPAGAFPALAREIYEIGRDEGDEELTEIGRQLREKAVGNVPNGNDGGSQGQPTEN